MRTSVRTVLLAAPLLGLLGLAACSGAGAGAPGDDLRSRPGADAASQTAAETAAVPPRRPHKEAVCHHTGADRWVPLSLPLTAAEKLVVDHGDFRYDTAFGQCCTRADCLQGQRCNVVSTFAGTPLGLCRTPIAGLGVDPVGLLLEVALFGPESGAVFPFSGTLTRTGTDTYLFSFAVGATTAQVQLASFVYTGAPLPIDTPVDVTITFPARNGELVTYSNATLDSLNFVITTPQLPGEARVALDNGFLYFDPATFTGIFSFTDGSSSYGVVLGPALTLPVITPTTIGAYPAGLYLNLVVNTVRVHLLVFHGAVYEVRL